MLWEGRGIGAIFVGRATVGEFSEKEIALLKTFADQAVIAIQNARLFNETKEALDHQTGLRRGAPGDLELGRGRAAGVRQDPGELRTALRRSARGDQPRRRGWRGAPGPLPRCPSFGAGADIPAAAQPRVGFRGGDPGAPRDALSGHGRRRGCARACSARRQVHGFQVRHFRADAVGGTSDRHDLGQPRVRRSLLRQGDRAAQDVRRPGGDRDPERAALQRDEGGARPAEGLRRGAAGDQRARWPTRNRCSTRSWRAAGGSSRARVPAYPWSARTAPCIWRPTRVRIGRNSSGTTRYP